MNISGNYADHYKAFAFRGGSGSSLISTLINEGTLYDWHEPEKNGGSIGPPALKDNGL